MARLATTPTPFQLLDDLTSPVVHSASRNGGTPTMRPPRVRVEGCLWTPSTWQLASSVQLRALPHHHERGSNLGPDSARTVESVVLHCHLRGVLFTGACLMARGTSGISVLALTSVCFFSVRVLLDIRSQRLDRAFVRSLPCNDRASLTGSDSIGAAY